MDAKRISDGTVVILKRIDKTINTQEVEITQLFSAEPMTSDPRNHCVRVLEVLESPIDRNITFLVLPYLGAEPYHPLLYNRSYDARRKVSYATRTSKSVRYYIIHFGISRRYPADCAAPRERPLQRGGNKTVPEFQDSDEPRNPFHTDIYYIGDLIRKDFVKVRP